MKSEIKIALILLFALLFIGLCVVVIFSVDNRSYKLNLPNQEKLKNISIENQERQEEVTDVEKIKEIIYVLSGSGKGRITKEESISDFPVNANAVIGVNFNFKESGASTIFIYIKNNKYYIEQPYNGVYKISGDEYNLVANYIR